MGTLADQFSDPVPARVSPATSSASQSEISRVLVASFTAPPATQTLGIDGVPMAAPDQKPLSPARLTALTCTSYCVSPVSPVRAYSKPPSAAEVHTPATSVQLASDLSATLLSM